MKAIGKYVVINKTSQERKTKGGLMLTDNAVSNLRYQTGVIESVGTEIDTLNVGDEIYFDKSAGHEILVNDEIRWVIRERDVVIVL